MDAGSPPSLHRALRQATRESTIMAKSKDKAQDPDKAQNAPPRKEKAQDPARTAPSGPSRIQRFAQYVEASKAELRKVSWPNLRDTRRLTLTVVAFMAVMALILGLVDLALSSLIKAILS
jgi:preprotein translocase subunit SecE